MSHQKSLFDKKKKKNHFLIKKASWKTVKRPKKIISNSMLIPVELQPTTGQWSPPARLKKKKKKKR
jgi:hypothetical protein